MAMAFLRPQSISESRQIKCDCMDGKICLVTGATSGIGLATAQGLARQGTTVVLVGRNPEKGARTVARIEQEVCGARVEFMRADLSVQAQIRCLAEDFKRRHSRLDVLVNN